MQISGNISSASSASVNNGTKVKNTVRVKTEAPQDTVNIFGKQCNKKNVVKTALIAAGIVTVGVGVALKCRQLKMLKQIPEDLRPLFKELKHKNGKEFVDSAYGGLVKHMGLEGVAPSSVNLTEKADGIFNTVTGGFKPVENTIEFSTGFVKKLTKKQQFNMLSHELKHCKQFTDVVRTEGLGIEALAKASVENQVKNLKFISIGGQITPEQAALLKEQKAASLLKELTEKFGKGFKAASELPKYAADSPQGKKAAEYLEAIRNYQELSLLGTGSKEYFENALEKEAYAFGNSMEKFIGAAMSPFEKVADIVRLIAAK